MQNDTILSHDIDYLAIARPYHIQEMGDYIMKKWVLLSVVVLGLSGCAGFNIDKFGNAPVKGSEFTTALVKEYKSFVASEAAQYDWRDADHFSQKGLRALAGENVTPENPNDWNLPSGKIAEITNYYHRLSYMLNNGAKTSAPSKAAIAMAKFDCWVEQQEENWQPNDINECRGEFMTAFNALEKSQPALAKKAKDYAAKMAIAKKQESKDTPASSNGVIYFDFKSSKLTPSDIREIKSVVKSAGKKAKYTVTGHTDTAGSEKLNLVLSKVRAQNVRQALIASGVAAKNIRVLAKGESDLAVQTGDNVREPKNRRAVISAE